MISAFRPTSPSDWHPEAVRAALAERGLTLSDLARRTGVAPSLFSYALRRPNGRCELAIAAALGLAPAAIWPSRYHPSGARRRVRRACARVAGRRG